MKHHRSPPRGIALLLVLATLVLAVTAAAGLARLATNVRLASHTAALSEVAERLSVQTEPPILDWLHRHSGRVTLPPHAASPRFLVLDDAVQLQGERCRVTITAFDQAGMVPAHHGATASSVLPADVLLAAADAGRAWIEHPGLDLLGMEGSERPVFPRTEESAVPAAGELLATHNPTRPGQAAAINVNTAPMPLVRAVYAARELGGLASILESRSMGRVASPGPITAPKADADVDAPVPVAVSLCWAFRIDCRVGRVRRAWWSVYSGTGSNWERVQHLAIDE